MSVFLAADAGLFRASQTASATESDNLYALSYEEKIRYSDYFDTYCNEPAPDAEIMLQGCDYKSAQNGVSPSISRVSVISFEGDSIA